jgi:hypothetical protein
VATLLWMRSLYSVADGFVLEKSKKEARISFGREQ